MSSYSFPSLFLSFSTLSLSFFLGCLGQRPPQEGRRKSISLPLLPSSSSPLPLPLPFSSIPLNGTATIGIRSRDRFSSSWTIPSDYSHYSFCSYSSQFRLFLRKIQKMRKEVLLFLLRLDQNGELYLIHAVKCLELRD